MRRVLLTVVASLLIVGAAITKAEASEAADAVPVAKWGLELKPGLFYPDVPQWSTFYGDDRGFSAALTMTRAVGRVIEIVVDGVHFHDRGAGYLVANNRPGGEMLYELYTLALGASLRTPRPLWNWLTPYAGVSAARAHYQELIDGGDRRRGYRDGTLVRAGVRVLLDDIEPSAAATLYSQFGIINSTLIIEWQQLETDEVAGYELGGRSIFSGLRLEF